MNEFNIFNLSRTNNRRIEFRKGPDGQLDIGDSDQVTSNEIGFGACISKNVATGNLSDFDYLTIEYFDALDPFRVTNSVVGLTYPLFQEINSGWTNNVAAGGYVRNLSSEIYQGSIDANDTYLIDKAPILRDFGKYQSDFVFTLWGGANSTQLSKLGMRLTTYKGGEMILERDYESSEVRSSKRWVNVGGEMVRQDVFYTNTINSLDVVGLLTVDTRFGNVDLELLYSLSSSYNNSTRTLTVIGPSNSSFALTNQDGVLIDTVTIPDNGQLEYALTFNDIDITRIDVVSVSDYGHVYTSSAITYTREIIDFDPVTKTMMIRVRPNAVINIVNQDATVVSTDISDADGNATLVLDAGLMESSTSLQIVSTTYTMSTWMVSDLLAEPLKIKTRAGVNGGLSVVARVSKLSVGENAPFIVVTLDSLGRKTIHHDLGSFVNSYSLLGPTIAEQPDGDRTLDVWMLADGYDKEAAGINATDIIQFSGNARRQQIYYTISTPLYSIPTQIPPALTDCSDLFTNVQTIDDAVWDSLSTWDFSNVVFCGSMFLRSNIKNPDLSGWNTGNVRNMASMFMDTSFNSNINSWDVSKVLTFNNMFYACRQFNQPLNNWDVSGCEVFMGMFNSAEVFNQDISMWDMSNAKNLVQMFTSAKAFNQPIGSWDVSNVTDMYGLFNLAYVFNQPLNNWNVSKVTTMDFMFAAAHAFNQPLNNWDTSSLVSTQYMFWISSFNQDISNWKMSKVTNMTQMFTSNQAFNQDLSQWCVPLVTSLPTPFAESTFLPENRPVWGTCPRGY